MFVFSNPIDVSMKYEIYKNNVLVKEMQVRAPNIVHKMNFMDLIEQCRREAAPMRVRFSKMDTIFNTLEQKSKQLENDIQFANSEHIRLFGE